MSHLLNMYHHGRIQNLGESPPSWEGSGVEAAVSPAPLGHMFKRASFYSSHLQQHFLSGTVTKSRLPAALTVK